MGSRSAWFQQIVKTLRPGRGAGDGPSSSRRRASSASRAGVATSRLEHLRVPGHRAVERVEPRRRWRRRLAGPDRVEPGLEPVEAGGNRVEPLDASPAALR